MKKLLILATVSFGLFTACSNNADKEAGSTSDTTQESMEMTVDSAAANAYADSTQAAAEKAAKDSADAAHGHSH